MVNKTLWLLISLFFSQLFNVCCLHAQHNNTSVSSVVYSDDNSLFVNKKAPQYPEGPEALEAFIKQNLRYPKSALRDKKEGVVCVKCIVNIAGTLTNIELLKELTPDCNREALRVVSLMPKWIPGTINGELCSLEYVFCVKFFLPDSLLNNDDVKMIISG